MIGNFICYRSAKLAEFGHITTGGPVLRPDASLYRRILSASATALPPVQSAPACPSPPGGRNCCRIPGIGQLSGVAAPIAGCPAPERCIMSVSRPRGWAGSGRPRSVGWTRLASRRAGVTLGLSFGKGSTPLVGPQRFSQLLPQAFILRQRALQLLLQRLHSPFEFLLPTRGVITIRPLHQLDDATNPTFCSALVSIPCLLVACW